MLSENKGFSPPWREGSPIIKAVLSDPQRAIAWGKNGRKRVEQYFTWDQAADHTIKTYEYILEKSG